MYVIRKRIRIPPEKSIFLFIADMNMVPIGKSINEVYDEYKDDDGFLYITFAPIVFALNLKFKGSSVNLIFLKLMSKLLLYLDSLSFIWLLNPSVCMPIKLK